LSSLHRHLPFMPTRRSSDLTPGEACAGAAHRGDSGPMRLEARGHPLHTRALSVVLAARADGKLDVHGAVLDLRKRGFVPVAGDRSEEHTSELQSRVALVCLL